MTPTHPLTPSENAEINAMLKAACTQMDSGRIERIATLSYYERAYLHHAKFFMLPEPTNGILLDAQAHHLAAALLAWQMAERL